VVTEKGRLGSSETGSRRSGQEGIKKVPPRQKEYLKRRGERNGRTA